jgi:anthranilate/para-aminobenzoate synthase component II
MKKTAEVSVLGACDGLQMLCELYGEAMNTAILLAKIEGN